MDKPKRSEPIKGHFLPREAEVVRAAARLEQTSVSEFTRLALLDRARRVLALATAGAAQN